MKLLLGLFVFAGSAISGLLAGNSLYCLSCNYVKDPRQCTAYTKCHHGYQCHTSVDLVNGESLYTLSCQSQYVCNQLSSLIGRRASATCSQCCYGVACNRYLCAANGTTPTTGPTTITTRVAGTTATPTRVAGITAATTATTSRPMTTIKPATHPVTSTQGVPTSHTFLCIDLETSAIKCADLKSQGHCAIISGTWYETAKLRCRKTCGFC